MTPNHFSCAYWPFVHRLGEKCLFPSFAHFAMRLYILLLVCKANFYHLDTDPLWAIWFSDTFSHSAGSLFTFLMMLFETQKFYFWSSIDQFFFHCCAFGVISKKSSSNPKLRGFILMCSTKSFIVLVPTFRSMIYFELRSFTCTTVKNFPRLIHVSTR